MDNTFDFSVFSRQSSKGIIVNYFQTLYKIIKSSWVLIPIFFTKKSSEINLGYIFLGIGLLLIYILIRAILLYINFKFKVSDGNFILKQGIIRKSNISIPFEKIQNINFKQNFVQQIINVTQVEIETAGGKMTEISIKALSKEQAIALKVVLLDKINIISKVLEEDKEEDKNINIQKIATVELVKVSLSENHLKSFLLLISFGYSIYLQAKDVLFKTDMANKFGVAIEENTNTLFSNITYVSILVLVCLFLAVLYSFILTFLRHFNLRVLLRNNTLEIAQGLITKRNDIIKKQKVQNIKITTNPFKKVLGIYNVTFKQAVSGMQKRSKIIKIVGTKKEQLTILKDILFKNNTFKTDTVYIPHTYYKTIMLFRSFFFLLVLNIFFLFIPVFSYTEIVVVNSLLIPTIVLLVYLKYKKCYYKINEDMLVKSSGQIATDLIYLEHFKMQHVQLKQTIFQKRKNIVDLVVQTASGKIRIPCMPKQEALNLYNYMLYKTQTETAQWM